MGIRVSSCRYHIQKTAEGHGHTGLENANILQDTQSKWRLKEG